MGQKSRTASGKLWRQKLARQTLQGLARSVVPLMCRPEIQGNPLKENAIWASSHTGQIDPMLMLYAASKTGTLPRFSGSKAWFDLPGVGRLLKAAKYTSVAFIAPNSGVVDTRKTKPEEIIEEGIEALNNGETLATYPSVRITHNPNSSPESVRSGAARQALATGASIQPVTALGAQNVLPFDENRKEALRNVVGNLVRRRRPQTVIYFGDPVPVERVTSGKSTKEQVQEVTRRLEEAFIRDHKYVTQRHPGIGKNTDLSHPSNIKRQQ